MIYWITAIVFLIYFLFGFFFAVDVWTFDSSSKKRNYLLVFLLWPLYFLGFMSED
jgi:hypothetical protein